MPTTVVAPDQPARRAVIVVQEAFGVDDHIVDVCGRFAALGYLAVVLLVPLIGTSRSSVTK